MQLMSTGINSTNADIEKELISELHHSLMQLEMQLLDQLEVNYIYNICIFKLYI